MADNMTFSRVKQLENVQRECKELFKKKNQDYGDAFATYGTVGILVRLGDKIQRLQSITSNGINLVEDEKLRDTLLDLHNYAAMGIMLLDEDDVSDIQLQDNNEENISVVGSTGNTYNIKKFNDANGKQFITCSCPSYEYCRNECKTCKHIKSLELSNN